MSLSSLRLLVALIAWLYATPCLANDAASALDLRDEQNENLAAGPTFDLAAHHAKWDRRSARWTRIGWAGATFALAADLALFGAYFTGAPFFWGFGVPFFALGTALLVPAAIIPGHGLQELGARAHGPGLGYLAVAFGSAATMCAAIAFVGYANDMSWGYVLSDATVVFTSAAMLLGFATHGLAIRQMVVDARVRRTSPLAAAPHTGFRVAVAPRIDRAPGVAFVGTF